MAALVVEIEERPLERIAADALMVGVSPDDRPLRGAAARADWRMCGELWQFLSSGRLTGALGEAALISTAGALRSPVLLVLGMGPRAALSAASWHDFGREAVRRALELRLQRAVAGFVTEAAALGPEGTRAVFAGAALAAADSRAELRVVLAGEGAAERLAELSPLDRLELPPGAKLRLPAAAGKLPKSTTIPSGDFPHDQRLRFK